MAERERSNSYKEFQGKVAQETEKVSLGVVGREGRALLVLMDSVCIMVV